MDKEMESIYSDFIDNFKNKEVKEIVYFGVVTQVDPELRVKINDLELLEKDLKILEKFKIRSTNGYYVRCVNEHTSHGCAISHNLNKEFEIGDEVMMISQKVLRNKNVEEKFVIIDRVVSI